MVLNKSSVFVESPLRCMVSLPFFLFRVPRLEALNTGWPFLWVAVQFYWLVSPILLFESKKILPLLFRSRTSSVFARISSCNPWLLRDTLLIIPFFWPINVIEHWLEHDRVLELFGFDVLSAWIFVDLLKNLRWRKSREHIPRFFGKKDTSWILPLDLPILPWLLCFHSSVPNIERNPHRRHTLLPMPIWSLDRAIKTDFVQDGDELASSFTFRISSEYSIVNFWVMVNTLSEDTNIPHFNTCVLCAANEKVEQLAVIPNFFCQNWKILVMYWWFLKTMFRTLVLKTHPPQVSL